MITESLVLRQKEYRDAHIGMKAIIEQGDDLILRLHVQPGAKRTEVVGMHGDALKVRLAAPPLDGKANEALVRFVAEVFGVPGRQVELLSGHTGRSKKLRVISPTLRPDRQWAD